MAIYQPWNHPYHAAHVVQDIARTQPNPQGLRHDSMTKHMTRLSHSRCHLKKYSFSINQIIMAQNVLENSNVKMLA